MKKEFEIRFTGWAFIFAAVLLWGGWMLSSHTVGEYLVASDFPSIGENIWYWIWMFRIYIFGWVAMMVAMMALASITAKKPYSVILTPGIGMVIIGTFTLALASAYFYNFGAWGVGKTDGMSATEIEQFMNEILYTNQYVTCFMRFGRIFSGVGLVLLGAAFVKWNIVKPWLGWFTILLGLAAMIVILSIPEYFDTYKPLFHVKALWLLVMGVMILRQGVNVPDTKS